MAYAQKMKVQFIGVGLRKTGNKNGRDYDFIPCVIAFEDKNFEGYRACETVVPYALYENLFAPICPGDQREIHYHWYKKRNGDFAIQIDEIF